MPLKRLLFSHYFYSGLGVAGGILGVAAAAYALFGLQTAVAASTGALGVSFADIPNFGRYKFLQMLGALVLAGLVTLAVGFSQPSPWLTGTAILIISFVAALLTAYGRDAMPVSFAMFFMMVLALGTPFASHAEVLRHTLQLLLGGGAYLVYALLLAAALKYRTRQQALAECLYEFARLLHIKSTCYEASADLDAGYRTLIRQQTILNERLQAARDFVFRDVASDRDARLAGILLATLDVYEHVLSSQTDYAFLRRHVAGSDVLVFLRDLARKAAEDIEQVSYAVLRNRAAWPAAVSYKAELTAIAYELDRLRGAQGVGSAAEWLGVLAAVVGKVRRIIEHVERLHVVARTPVAPGEVLGGADLTPFLSRPSYSPRVLIRHLRPGSPIFRYAARTTLAMGCAWLLIHLLPWATHGQWILLTVAVIMRLNFSQTKQRRMDRVAGNIAGCLFTAVVLHLVSAAWMLLVVILGATVVAHTFATIRYRYTAAAGCVAGLLQLHLLDPGGAFVISERILDTLVGALLAYAFSFVLPTWEYRNLPRLAAALLAAAQEFVATALVIGAPDLEVRLARKRLHDAIAAFAAAFGRMLDEPASRHRGVGELSGFLTLNYLLAAHLAAVRVWLRHRLHHTDAARVAELMAGVRERVAGTLGDAAEILSGKAEAVRASGGGIASSAALESATDSAAEWGSEALLRRRLGHIQDDVQRIRGLSLAIARAW